jgi:hypothetical protein
VKGQNGNDMSEELFGKKESPFKVPDNYFDDFEKRMMEKLEDNPTEKRGKVVSILSVVRPWIAMAAGFILIAVIYYQAPAFFDRQSETQQMSVTENESEDDFINSLAFMVDENDINELIVSEDTTIVLPPDTFYIENFTEDELAALTYFDFN